MWAPFKLKLPRRRPRSLFSFTPMMMHDRRGWFARHSGLVFLALTVFTFLQLGFHASNRFYSQPSSPTSSSSSSRWWTSLTSSSPYGPPVLKAHPIPQLIEDAESAYKKKLSKQSRTLKDAVVEYKKRYGRMPPKGFDKWFEMAMENKVIMTDEYDGMMSDLEPFWALSGLEVRRRAFQVGSLPSIDVVRVRDGKAKTVNLNKGFEDSEVGARAAGFRDMIGKVAHLLPDLDFPINAKAESRVIVPWEHTQHPNMTQQDSSVGIEEMLGGKFIADWRGDGGSVWESWRRTCPPNSTARRLFESIRTPFSVSLDSKNYLQTQSQRRDPSSLSSSSSSSTLSASGSSDSNYIPGLNEHGTGPDFSFTPSTAYSTLDFCSSPHAHYSQGHFFSDWRVIPALYPIFSPAKARGFSDIRIPSHYYYGATPRYTYGWDEVNLEFHRLPAKNPKINAIGDEGAAVVGDGLYGGEAGEGGEETVVMDPMDVPWEKKLDKVFWRGATTGGGNNPPGWMGGYQRHRFLRMASVGNVNVTEEDGEIVRTVVFPDPSSLDEQEKKGSTAYLSLPLSLSELNEEIMDVAFTKAVSAPAYPGGLDALLKDYRWSGSVALGHHWQYKYLLDLDGMSYSGRFLAFLESGSVPVKATVYDEWWAGWCVPWVHFIPLSTSYKEIYNIHAFFSGPPQVALKALDSSASSSESESEQESADLTNPNTEKVYNADGDARLRRIARAGRQWKKTQGRRVDMELYVYRLALEWARLWADDRDAASMEIR